jgi:ribulose-5-phosphate 4-epimerase/fuculose-1-phosphate aldolase
LRRDVALANRILERFGLAHAFGHASARVPGTETFLIPPRRSPAFADEKALLLLDLDCKVLAGKGLPNSEAWIHARIYAARSEVGGVVHAHPPACICLTGIGQPHRIVHNHGGAFVDGVGTYDRVGLIRTRELGDALARALGTRVAVMMRGHGITTATTEIRGATIAALYLEESSRLQLAMLAAAAGDPARIRVYDRDEAERVNDQLEGPMLERAWDYFSKRV